MAGSSTPGQGRSAQAGQALSVDLEVLFSELRGQKREAGDGYTTPELCEIMGRGVHYVRSMVRSAQGAGKCRATRVYREDITGVQRRVPAYVFEE